MNLPNFFSRGVAVWTEPFVASLPSEDALRVTTDSFDAASVLVWSIQAAVTVVCVGLLVKSASLLNDSEYERAFWALAASIIFGISPYLAKTLFF